MIYRRLVVVIAALPFVVGTTMFAHAQNSNAGKGDLRRVEGCFQQITQRKGSAYACIGRISKSCMDRPGGSSTMGMRSCTDREAEAWDKLLNRYYKRLRRQMPNEARAKLKEIQRAWINWRNIKCDLGYTLFEGGTLAGVMAGECVMEATAIRAIELGRLSRSVEN